MDWTASFAYADTRILWIDAVALAWFLIGWIGYTRYADQQYFKRLNLIRIMDDMRTRWMHRTLQRDNRMADATLLGNIMRTISFFASTTILILIGLFTILGAGAAAAEQIIHAVPFVIGATPFMWEVKICLLMLIFIYAFFKLTWSLRQYNYACIIVGAAPPMSEGKKQQHTAFADRASKLIGNAGRHFNMGLRAYYFGMAVVGWFLNGFVFIAATALVVFVVYRREFRSHTVNNLVAIEDL